MTQSNWLHVVETTDLAGDYSYTCLVAALDCLFDDFDIPIWFYHYYTQAFIHQSRYGPNIEQTKAVYTNLIHLITGSTRIKQVIFKNIRNEEDTVQLIDHARLGGWKIIAKVEDLHVVGLRPHLHNQWEMVGNALPVPYHYLSSSEVFCFLHLSPSKIRLAEYNIALFPPPR